MMATSAFSMPSCSSSGVERVRDFCACIMSSATRNRSTPPAILKAPSVMPKKRKMSVPAAANTVSVMPEVMAARRAVAFFCAGVSFAVIARKIGSTASGSTTKKIAESETRQNVANSRMPPKRPRA